MTSPINFGENLNPIDIPSSSDDPQNNTLLFGDSIGAAPKAVALSIPIGEYSNLVGTARDKNAQELHDIEITTPTLFTALADAATAASRALANLRANDILIYQAWINAANLKPSVDNAIDAYNAAIAAAAAKYNSSNKTPSEKKADYDADVNAANSTYLSATAPYNQAVTALLNLQASMGMVLISLPSAPNPAVSTPIPTPPTAPPYATIPVFNFPFPPTTEDAFLAQYYVPAATAAVKINNQNLIQMNIYKGYLNSQSSQLNTGDITLPAAFIDENVAVVLDAPSETDTGGNSIYSSMSVDLGNVDFEQILSQPLYKATVQQAKTEGPIPPGLDAVEFGVAGGVPLELRARNTEMPGVPLSISHIDLIGQLQNQAFRLLAQVASDAAEQTVRLLPNKLGAPDLASPAFDSISALTFAKGIHNLVNSGAIEENIQNLIAKDNNFSNLPPDQQKNLVDQLAAAQKLNLLRLGVSQVNIALKTPGLGAQLFGNALKNAPGLPSIGDVLQTQPGEQLNSVVQNPFSQILLKKNLSQSIQTTPTGIAGSQVEASNSNEASSSATNGKNSLASQVSDQQSINQAVRQVAQSSSRQPISDSQDLHTQFLNAFSDAGFPTGLATDLAQTATNQVKTAAAIPFLGLAFTPIQLKKALSANPNFSIATLTATDNEQVKTALASIVQKSDQGKTTFGSYADLHTGLVKELIGAKISQNSAEILANQAVLFFKPKAEVSGPPTSSVATGSASTALKSYPSEAANFNLLSPEALAEQLHTLIASQLSPSLGKHQAKAIADQFTPTILGANSIQTQLGEQLNVIKGVDSQALLDDLRKNIRVLGSPNVPLYIIKDRIDHIVRFEAGAPTPSYVDPSTGSLRNDKEASEPLNFNRNISIKI